MSVTDGNRLLGLFIPHTDKVRGFVIDVATGLLTALDPAGAR